MKRFLPIPMRSALAILGVMVLAAVAAGCGGTSEAGAGGQNVVRFGSVGGLSDAGLYIADAKGYFDEAGIQLERHRMGGGSEITTAVATGNVDVAGFAVTAGLFNSVTQGLEATVVGDKQSVGPEASATRLVAQKPLVAGDVETSLANLKGKTVAVTDTNSATVVMLDWLLQKYGMSVDDVTLETLTFADMSSALIQGSLDAGIVLEPFLTTALQSGDVAEVSDFAEIMPERGASIVPLVYSQDFAADRETAQAFMTAYMRGVRDYNAAFLGGGEKDEVAQIIAEASDQPLDVILAANPPGLDPDQTVSRKFLEDMQAWYADQGLVGTPADLGELIDPSFAEAAVEELGAS